MYTYVVKRRLWVACVLSACACSVVGCSGGADDDTAADAGGAGGAGGEGGEGGELGLPDEVVGPRGRAFVPEGLTLEYVGTGDSRGLEIVSATLLQSAGLYDLPAWYVAVRNTGFEIVCSIQFQAEFFDASGASLGENIIDSVSAPMWSRPGGFVACLGPDDVGMVEVEQGLEDVTVADVARVGYAFNAIVRADVERVTDVTLQNLVVKKDAYDEWVMEGELHNGLSVTISAPRVDFFTVDALGRPYGRMWTIDLMDLAPGASWSFATLGLFDELERPNGYVSYFSFHEPF